MSTNITELSDAWLINYLSGDRKSMLMEGCVSPASACIELTTRGADLDQVATVLKAYGDTKVPMKMVNMSGTVYILFGMGEKSYNSYCDNIKNILNIDNETEVQKHDWSKAVNIGVDGVTPKDALWDSLVSGAIYDTREGILYIFGTNYTKTCKGYPLLGSMVYTPMHVKYTIDEDNPDFECLKEIFSHFDRKIPNVYFSP